MTTTATNIDGPKALELLRAARDRRGADYVYPNARTAKGVGNCVYVDVPDYEEDEDTKPCPSCIVGEVTVTDLGIDPNWFVRAKVNASEAPEVLRLLQADHNNSVKFSPLAVRLFFSAQDAQDHGKTWGRAVEVAEETYNEYAEAARETSMESADAFYAHDVGDDDDE